MNKLFGTDVAKWPGTEMTLTDWVPTVDIEESPEEYVVKAELPGIDKKDVKITCNDGVLSITGERKQEKEVKNRKYHRIERSYGSFMRSFTLPVEVDDKKIVAEQKDGVLFVHLPKAAEKKPVEGFEIKIR
jgi:HSP20 family protein